MNGEVPLEDEVAAIFDLIYRIATVQIDGRAVFFRELRNQQPGPVIQTLLDGGRAQLIGGRLQCIGVRD